MVGVDNLSSGNRNNLAHLDGSPNFVFVEHDAVYPIPEDVIGDTKFDWVMHFASPASPPSFLEHPIETMRINGEGAYQLLTLARSHGAKFFLASTSECYGDPDVHPQVETYWGNVNPIGARSVYDEGKRYAEAMTQAFHRKFGLSVRHIRIFNTYGPRMDPFDGRVVTNFIRQALAGEDLTIYGTGEQTRSFQYVDDLIEGIWRLMNVDYCGPVNLGNPGEYTVRQLADLVNEAMGGHHTIVYRELPQDDPRRRRPDISLAKSLLNWEPKVPVQEGLRRTIEAMRAKV